MQEKVYPNAIPTVDIAVLRLNPDHTYSLLLGRKEHEPKWRFVGGFVDADDSSYETAAVRELFEETNLVALADEIKYVGSTKIDDPRYRNHKDKIITHLYLLEIPFETSDIHPKDDIKALQWFPLSNFSKEEIMEVHYPIVDLFLKYTNHKLKA
ncbi:NUDIX domain-containing protein [Myroides fluvii]|uniref:NUDIX domain-containing protein n=1 Tax=Myroides fluvii TaxID=2572594 RepID=UPI00131E0141|nr:NUDIX domain-containing protein [Myroides fluvii]